MRVAVTGLGVVCPSGGDPETVYRMMIEGCSAVHRAPDAPDVGLRNAVVALCGPDISIDGVANHELLNIDAVSRFSLYAGAQAVRAAERAGALPRERMPILWGCSMGGIGTFDQAFADLYLRKKKRVRPTTVPMVMPSATAYFLAHHLGLLGPSTVITAACASSALAIGQACRMIERGEADAALAGGADSMVTPSALRAWHMTGALSSADPEDAARSCKPFDGSRSGFAMGEGAAALVLENAEKAERRGAEIFGYVRGYGHTCDASHISKPTSPSQAAAMREALNEAKLSTDQIDYLNAHGTATQIGDQVEAESIQAVFGHHVERMAVGSTKAMHGHTLGASGALEALISLLALGRRLLPPNPHLASPDAQMTALRLPREALALSAAKGFALSNSFAFGGINASLVFESP